MDKKTVETYNKSAEVYDNETADFWNLFPRNIINLFADLVKDGQVLDIGSGPGRDAGILRDMGLDVICLDASKRMVEMTKEKGFVSVEGDLLQLPFEDESFDGVWAYTSLLHVKRTELDQALNEVKRVIKPNGAFGLGMHSGQGEEYRVKSNKLKGSEVTLPRLFAYYTKEELTEKLESFGFKVVYFEAIKPGKREYLHFLAIKG